MLHVESDRWINKYLDKSEISGNFPWTKERAKELSRVPLQELIDDPYYLGMKDILYPKWKDVLYELWDERKKRKVNLVCFIGSIGVGKTELSSVILWLSIFELLCKYNPQSYYGLNPDSLIALICMSITTQQARKVTFGKLYPKIVGSPFFKDYFPPDPRLKREVRIPKANITVFPGTSSEASALGYDIYCVSGDTEILTTEGNKRIDSLVNKEVELYSCNLGFKLEKSVGKCVYSDLKPVYEVTFDNGYSIKCTAEHEFLYTDYFNNDDYADLDLLTSTLRNIARVIIYDYDKNFQPYKIKSVKYIGKEKVYDIINVEPNNNFIANGIVVHNSGVIDEANSLEVIEDSKRAGVVETYDAAEEMHNAIWTRMTSRFMREGKVDGMIVMISSPRYPDDFLERKVKESKERGDESRIFWRRLRSWDMKPQIWQGERIWSGNKFRFDVDELRILDDDEAIPTNVSGELHEIITPPIELKNEFEKSPERALRDLDARPLLAIAPYFRNKGKVKDAFKENLVNPFNERTLSFNDDFKSEDDDNFFRYVHIDLATKKDAVGVAMCHVPRFISIDKTNIVSGDFTTEILNMPQIIVDFVGRIASQQGEEILFSDIQEILYQLTDLGFFINLISFDKFQSVYIQQQLRDDGYTVAELSIDRTSSKIIVDHDQKSERGRRDGYRKESTGRQYTAAYQALKDAIYEDRIKIPPHDFLLRELLRLETIRKNNIDLVTKPSKGSDDVAQALAGAVFNAVCNEVPMIEVNVDRGEGKDSIYDDFYDDLDEHLLDSDIDSDGVGISDDFYEKYKD